MISVYIVALVTLGWASNLIAYDYLDTYYGEFKKRVVVIAVFVIIPFALLLLVVGIIVQRKKEKRWIMKRSFEERAELIRLEAEAIRAKARREVEAKQHQYTVTFRWAIRADSESEAIGKAIEGDGEFLDETVEQED